MGADDDKTFPKVLQAAKSTSAKKRGIGKIRMSKAKRSELNCSSGFYCDCKCPSVPPASWAELQPLAGTASERR